MLAAMRVVQMRPSVSTSDKSCCLSGSTSLMRTSRSGRGCSVAEYNRQGRNRALLSADAAPQHQYGAWQLRRIRSPCITVMRATSSACFQPHSAAGTGTVRCTISGQTTQQQALYVRYQETAWDDTAAGTLRCAISGQMTQQQAPYGALSADRWHSSRHRTVRYQRTDSTAAGTGQCAISEQTTQQQAPYVELSANRRHSSRRRTVRYQRTDDTAAVRYQRTDSTAAGTGQCAISEQTIHCCAEKRASHGHAAGPAALEGQLRRLRSRPHRSHPIQPGLPEPTARPYAGRTVVQPVGRAEAMMVAAGWQRPFSIIEIFEFFIILCHFWAVL